MALNLAAINLGVQARARPYHDPASCLSLVNAVSGFNDCPSSDITSMLIRSTDDQSQEVLPHTMGFDSTIKVLAKRVPKFYRFL